MIRNILYLGLENVYRLRLSAIEVKNEGSTKDNYPTCHPTIAVFYRLHTIPAIIDLQGLELVGSLGICDR